MKALFAGLLLGAALATPVEASAQATAAGAHSRAAAEAAASAWPAIVQDYEPDPALWVLSDEDTTIYLLGTVHVLPEGFRWRSPRLDGIVAEADELIVESTEGKAREDALLAGLLESFAKRPRMSERLSPASGAKWLALGESVGMTPEEFDRLPPLLALFGLVTTLNAEATGSEGQFGVETVLEAEFRAAGKPIESIESAVDVILSLVTIDESQLIKELDGDLSRWDGKTPGTMFAPAAPVKDNAASANPLLAEEHAWAQGLDVDVRDQLFGNTPFTRVMGKRLLDNRNRAWAGWLERRLATPGTVLVAVGAGHLAGRNSVQEMLSARGLSAVRLD